MPSEHKTLHKILNLFRHRHSDKDSSKPKSDPIVKVDATVQPGKPPQSKVPTSKSRDSSNHKKLKQQRNNEPTTPPLNPETEHLNQELITSTPRKLTKKGQEVETIAENSMGRVIATPPKLYVQPIGKKPPPAEPLIPETQLTPGTTSDTLQGSKDLKLDSDEIVKPSKDVTVESPSVDATKLDSTKEHATNIGGAAAATGAATGAAILGGTALASSKDNKKDLEPAEVDSEKPIITTTNQLHPESSIGVPEYAASSNYDTSVNASSSRVTETPRDERELEHQIKSSQLARKQLGEDPANASILTMHNQPIDIPKLDDVGDESTGFVTPKSGQLTTDVDDIGDESPVFITPKTDHSTSSENDTSTGSGASTGIAVGGVFATAAGFFGLKRNHNKDQDIPEVKDIDEPNVNLDSDIDSPKLADKHMNVPSINISDDNATRDVETDLGKPSDKNINVPNVNAKSPQVESDFGKLPDKDINVPNVNIDDSKTPDINAPTIDSDKGKLHGKDINISDAKIHTGDINAPDITSPEIKTHDIETDLGKRDINIDKGTKKLSDIPKPKLPSIDKEFDYDDEELDNSPNNVINFKAVSPEVAVPTPAVDKFEFEGQKEDGRTLDPKVRTPSPSAKSLERKGVLGVAGVTAAEYAFSHTKPETTPRSLKKDTNFADPEFNKSFDNDLEPGNADLDDGAGATKFGIPSIDNSKLKDIKHDGSEVEGNDKSKDDVKRPLDKDHKLSRHDSKKGLLASIPGIPFLRKHKDSESKDVQDEVKIPSVDMKTTENDLKKDIDSNNVGLDTSLKGPDFNIEKDADLNVGKNNLNFGKTDDMSFGKNDDFTPENDVGLNVGKGDSSDKGISNPLEKEISTDKSPELHKSTLDPGLIKEIPLIPDISNENKIAASAQDIIGADQNKIEDAVVKNDISIKDEPINKELSSGKLTDIVDPTSVKEIPLLPETEKEGKLASGTKNASVLGVGNDRNIEDAAISGIPQQEVPDKEHSRKTDMAAAAAATALAGGSAAALKHKSSKDRRSKELPDATKRHSSFIKREDSGEESKKGLLSGGLFRRFSSKDKLKAKKEPEETSVDKPKSKKKESSEVHKVDSFPSMTVEEPYKSDYKEFGQGKPSGLDAPFDMKSDISSSQSKSPKFDTTTDFPKSDVSSPQSKSFKFDIDTPKSSADSKFPSLGFATDIAKGGSKDVKLVKVEPKGESSIDKNVPSVELPSEVTGDIPSFAIESPTGSNGHKDIKGYVPNLENDLSTKGKFYDKDSSDKDIKTDIGVAAGTVAATIAGAAAIHSKKDDTDKKIVGKEDLTDASPIKDKDVKGSEHKKAILPSFFRKSSKDADVPTVPEIQVDESDKSDLNLKKNSIDLDPETKLKQLEMVFDHTPEVESDGEQKEKVNPIKKISPIRKFSPIRHKKSSSRDESESDKHETETRGRELGADIDFKGDTNKKLSELEADLTEQDHDKDQSDKFKNIAGGVAAAGIALAGKSLLDKDDPEVKPELAANKSTTKDIETDITGKSKKELSSSSKEPTGEKKGFFSFGLRGSKNNDHVELNKPKVLSTETDDIIGVSYDDVKELEKPVMSNPDIDVGPSLESKSVLPDSIQEADKFVENTKDVSVATNLTTGALDNELPSGELKNQEKLPETKQNIPGSLGLVGPYNNENSSSSSSSSQLSNGDKSGAVSGKEITGGVAAGAIAAGAGFAAHSKSENVNKDIELPSKEPNFVDKTKDVRIPKPVLKDVDVPVGKTSSSSIDGKNIDAIKSELSKSAGVAVDKDIDTENLPSVSTGLKESPSTEKAKKGFFSSFGLRKREGISASKPQTSPERKDDRGAGVAAVAATATAVAGAGLAAKAYLDKDKSDLDKKHIDEAGVSADITPIKKDLKETSDTLSSGEKDDVDASQESNPSEEKHGIKRGFFGTFGPLRSGNSKRRNSAHEKESDLSWTTSGDDTNEHSTTKSLEGDDIFGSEHTGDAVHKRTVSGSSFNVTPRIGDDIYIPDESESRLLGDSEKENIIPESLSKDNSQPQIEKATADLSTENAPYAKEVAAGISAGIGTAALASRTKDKDAKVDADTENKVSSPNKDNVVVDVIGSPDKQSAIDHAKKVAKELEEKGQVKAGKVIVNTESKRVYTPDVDSRNITDKAVGNTGGLPVSSDNNIDGSNKLSGSSATRGEDVAAATAAVAGLGFTGLSLDDSKSRRKSTSDTGDILVGVKGMPEDEYADELAHKVITRLKTTQPEKYANVKEVHFDATTGIALDEIGRVIAKYPDLSISQGGKLFDEGISSVDTEKDLPAPAIAGRSSSDPEVNVGKFVAAGASGAAGITGVAAKDLDFEPPTESLKLGTNSSSKSSLEQTPKRSDFLNESLNYTTESLGKSAAVETDVPRGYSEKEETGVKLKEDEVTGRATLMHSYSQSTSYSMPGAWGDE
ncbi:uncharacterized protein SPAPADRAFT_48270 [Spathaspora passalidarum NRRL Y-27907]|uniref:Uncharacterized protein n=1 Tax=Spathaspora passalidarum (strain NRRL Y-27907 / 11-Y1) TaxID=619300 RepID=G3AGB2_SPAPN|nr:uncharacterized protein SPAPADRAFT_48270 [Spathaspora passalidarum NRRL Y-27907]EGW35251.1 hypothetical protein SPAPADRAFT_48270 [Spathaspora passalidarum NRRL Y-27907]